MKKKDLYLIVITIKMVVAIAFMGLATYTKATKMYVTISSNLFVLLLVGISLAICFDAFHNLKNEEE